MNQNLVGEAHVDPAELWIHGYLDTLVLLLDGAPAWVIGQITADLFLLHGREAAYGFVRWAERRYNLDIASSN